jgi:CRISPR-associated endonuclease/helicase Cas3
MELLAHSARPELGIRSQPYADHVGAVMGLATEHALSVARYMSAHRECLTDAVRLAAEFHDLGKLDGTNQKVLASGSATPLPLNHVDAGVAHLLGPQVGNPLAASLAFAHHAGLPDFADQRNRKSGYVLRDTAADPAGRITKELTDQRLTRYLALHRSVVPHSVVSGALSHPQNVVLSSLLFRIALSCLVDADHYDTARQYNSAVPHGGPPLRSADRLSLLDAYTRTLSELGVGGRTSLRAEIYHACRDADPAPSIYSCASPVGTGKTTAVMAHLLRAAVAKALRRIFVVLPFTNIIDQSVDVYRRGLVEHGEATAEVVAAHHHRLEFEDAASRQFAFLWHAPVVVTTAVQFFETLASNHPATLRKLHQLPGSAIFLDEAHAALPAHLWPQAWRWLRELTSRWGCHVVLGSGSLTRFWELEEFSDGTATVPDLISPRLAKQAALAEGRRVRYRAQAARLSLENLIEWIPTLPGPRLLIVNTVQSAAAIAREIDRRRGRAAVEHLSTALCPRDRKTTLDRVKERLKQSSDTEWTLVATSCAEAGLDLSFRTGLRERCSLNSVVQIGGRVNRTGHTDGAEIWDFQFEHAEPLRAHPAFEAPTRVLGELFDEGRVGPEWCTEAMRREIRQEGLRGVAGEILKAEQARQFPQVTEKFVVIGADTITAVVEPGLAAKLRAREKVRAGDLQLGSVQIWRHHEAEYALEQVAGYPGLYCWKLAYDGFLGYMAGVLKMVDHKQHGTII